MYMSLIRPVMARFPAGSSRPASPVCSQPSASIAAAVAAEQVLDLVDHGVSDFHFYTMNRADLVFAISHLLGIRPKGAQKAA
jgi:hypothetical protein